MEKAIDKLKQLLDEFERQKTPFTEDNVDEAISKLIKEVGQDESDISVEFRAEKMAFALSEGNRSYEDENGSYFGPKIVRENKEGERLEYPDIRQISKEMLEYWENRAVETKRPVLKARYADLVWNFSKSITQKKPNPDMARIVIDATLDAAKELLYESTPCMKLKLKRAIDLSRTLNDQIRLEKVVNATFSFEKSVNNDDKPRLGRFLYDLLLKNKKVPLTKSQESYIIESLEKMLNRNINSENPNPFVAKSAAERLAEYYQKNGTPEKAKEVLLKYGNSYLGISQKASPLFANELMKEVYSDYKRYGMKDETASILRYLQENHKRMNEDLIPISHEFTFKKNDLDKDTDEILAEDMKSAIAKITKKFIPQKEVLKEQVDSEEFGFQHLIKTVTLDHYGRPTSQIGILENDLDGHIILQMLRNISFSSIYLRYVMGKFVKRYALSEKILIDYLFNSPVFNEGQKEIIEKGIKFYLEGDAISCVHLLIPQIEAVFRELVYKTGGVTYKNSRSGDWALKTFDEILRTPNIHEIFNDSIALYLRILFTDQRGLNLRNSMCHGFLPSKGIDMMIADRVFHVLLLLGALPMLEKSPEDEL